MRGDLIIGRTPSGSGWKAYAWGQPNGHMQDWRGANYRLAVIPGQPTRGYALAWEAFRFATMCFPTEVDFERWVRKTAGSFCTDARFRALGKVHDVNWRDGAWVLDVPRDVVPSR